MEQEKLVTSTRPDAQGWLVGVERSSDSDKSKTGKPTGAFVYLNYQDRKSDKEVVNPQMVKELEFLLSNLPEKQDELQTFLSQFKTNDPKYVKIIPIVIQNLFDNGCNLEDLNLKLQNLDFANISFIRVQLKKHIKKEKARQELYLELGDISQTKLANAIEQISRVPGGLKAVLEAMARGPKVMARLGLDIDQKTLLALEKLAAKGNTKGHELLKALCLIKEDFNPESIDTFEFVKCKCCNCHPCLCIKSMENLRLEKLQQKSSKKLLTHRSEDEIVFHYSFDRLDSIPSDELDKILRQQAIQQKELGLEPVDVEDSKFKLFLRKKPLTSKELSQKEKTAAAINQAWIEYRTTSLRKATENDTMIGAKTLFDPEKLKYFDQELDYVYKMKQTREQLVAGFTPSLTESQLGTSESISLPRTSQLEKLIPLGEAKIKLPDKETTPISTIRSAEAKTEVKSVLGTVNISDEQKLNAFNVLPKIKSDDKLHQQKETIRLSAKKYLSPVQKQNKRHSKTRHARQGSINKDQDKKKTEDDEQQSIKSIISVPTKTEELKPDKVSIRVSFRDDMVEEITLPKEEVDLSSETKVKIEPSKSLPQRLSKAKPTVAKHAQSAKEIQKSEESSAASSYVFKDNTSLSEKKSSDQTKISVKRKQSGSKKSKVKTKKSVDESDQSSYSFTLHQKGSIDERELESTSKEADFEEREIQIYEPSEEIEEANLGVQDTTPAREVQPKDEPIIPSDKRLITDTHDDLKVKEKMSDSIDTTTVKPVVQHWKNKMKSPRESRLSKEKAIKADFSKNNEHLKTLFTRKKDSKSIYDVYKKWLKMNLTKKPSKEKKASTYSIQTTIDGSCPCLPGLCTCPLGHHLFKKQKAYDWTYPSVQAAPPLELIFPQYVEIVQASTSECICHSDDELSEDIHFVSSDTSYRSFFSPPTPSPVKLKSYTKIQNVYKPSIYQRLVVLVKPEAIRYKDVILRAIKVNGLDILNERTIYLTAEQVADIYVEQYGSPYFPLFVQRMTASSIVVLSIAGNYALRRWNKIIGPEGTLSHRWFFPDSMRRRFGAHCDVPEAIYVSRDIETAKVENHFFFPFDILDPIIAENGLVRDYCGKHINPTLASGLSEIARMRPEDPLKALGRWLLLNNPYQPNFSPEEVSLCHT